MRDLANGVPVVPTGLGGLSRVSRSDKSLGYLLLIAASN